MAVAPLVSVVIPCFNHAPFLGDAVNSALSQTRDRVEIIVIDDGSTDNSAAVAADFGDAIVLLRQENQGLSTARNAGVLAARGELIQLLDSDDVLREDALERSTAAALNEPHGAVFVGSWDEIDERGRTMNHVDAPHLPFHPFHALFDPIAVGPPCRYLVRRAAFARVGLFDAGLQSCEDWDMWMRMAAAGFGFVTVPEARAGYRNYSTSMSKNHRRMWRSGTTVLDRAKRTHGHCSECRRAYRDGVARWREWCYYSMLVPQMHDLRVRRCYPKAVALGLRALVDDPRLVPLLATSLEGIGRH